MRKKIFWGMSILSVGVVPLAFVSACGDTNKNNSVDKNTETTTKKPDTPLVNKEKRIYPEPKIILYLSEVDKLKEVFFKEKGEEKYFAKYTHHDNGDLRENQKNWSDGSFISKDGLWFERMFWTLGGVNNSGVIVLSYHEFYDWLHARNPLRWPYLTYKELIKKRNEI